MPILTVATSTAVAEADTRSTVARERQGGANRRGAMAQPLPLLLLMVLLRQTWNAPVRRGSSERFELHACIVLQARKGLAAI